MDDESVRQADELVVLGVELKRVGNFVESVPSKPCIVSSHILTNDDIRFKVWSPIDLKYVNKKATVNNHHKKNMVVMTRHPFLNYGSRAGKGNLFG